MTPALKPIRRLYSMPICTSCTCSIPYLYTVYESDHNLRLEQCPNPRCRKFVDPYVEHDSLTILLDLILLKLGVYRHLLYNRGTPPRSLKGKEKKTDGNESKSVHSLEISEDKSTKELDRWWLLFQLGSALVLVDAFIRSSYLNIDRVSPDTTRWTKQTALAFLRILLGTTAETLAFHGGIILTCYLVMKLMTAYQTLVPPKTSSNSSIRKEFRLSMISFSLFYSSMTKLFLLLLTIWHPAPTQSIEYIRTPLPEWTKLFSFSPIATDIVTYILETLDDGKLDREWIVRNILGGMCAGFGLRVILDIHPVFSSVIILSGWVAKTAVATLLSGWVGGNESNGQAWLAYSIP